MFGGQQDYFIGEIDADSNDSPVLRSYEKFGKILIAMNNFQVVLSKIRVVQENPTTVSVDTWWRKIIDIKSLRGEITQH